MGCTNAPTVDSHSNRPQLQTRSAAPACPLESLMQTPSPGMHWKWGGGYLSGAQPPPSYVPLTANAGFDGIRNRQ